MVSNDVQVAVIWFFYGVNVVQCYLPNYPLNKKCLTIVAKDIDRRRICLINITLKNWLMNTLNIVDPDSRQPLWEINTIALTSFKFSLIEMQGKFQRN